MATMTVGELAAAKTQGVEVDPLTGERWLLKYDQPDGRVFVEPTGGGVRFLRRVGDRLTETDAGGRVFVGLDGLEVTGVTNHGSHLTYD